MRDTAWSGRPAGERDHHGEPLRRPGPVTHLPSCRSAYTGNSETCRRVEDAQMLPEDIREWPISEPIDPPDIREAVLRAIRTRVESGQALSLSYLVNAEQVAIDLGMAGERRQQFARNNRPTFPSVANEFVNHLLRVGVLELWHGDGGDVVVPDNRREALQSLEAVSRENFRVLVSRVSDPDLRRALEPLALGGASSDVIAETAVKQVESRIRDRALEPERRTRIQRHDLGAIAFRPDGGVLVYSDRDDEQGGLMRLCQGFFLLMGNEPHHSVSDIPYERLIHVVALADYLCLCVNASIPRPE